jgi:hypothetical protein
MLFAAGDFGVASAPGDGSPNGCLGPKGEIFNPQYPSNVSHTVVARNFNFQLLATSELVTTGKTISQSTLQTLRLMQ